MKMADYQGKEVLVLGLAKSGTEAARILLDLGAVVTVNDQTPYEENQAAKELEKLGATVVCGSHPDSLVHGDLDLMIKNPGIPYRHSLIQKAMRLSIPVVTEIELAWQIAPCDMIGITGSNGKTTTTTMTAKMLEGGMKTPVAAGNIGEVASKEAYRATSEHVLVVELSSFQLQGTRHFNPHIAVFLNLVEAHLDYHGTMEEYASAKSRLFLNQSEEDFLIYNLDDVEVSRLTVDAKSRCIPFSTSSAPKGGSFLQNGMIYILGEPLMRVEDFALPGEYNLSNALAAATAAVLAGANREQVRRVMMTFSGVRHRLQYVDTIGDVTYYNNSKATNVPATVKALEAFGNRKMILIAGGLDRKLSFQGLKDPMNQTAKAVITYGETAEQLAMTAKEAGVPTILSAETLQEAVEQSRAISEPGDIVLLSPACASWDQFKTFEERGECFIEAVRKIKEETP
ncbi:UDP-N-acetylmuramoylalanine--D-glutamate ligase [Salisediminibacterium beveridgei]|uniref:UDP-N-acetylmuramoylalanine--D-glutamate ligase n=2 Tax=Salisediminibacterium beveridgei TaxID=632773 RepID=A0A1D7QW85_9BACI|nr:UDP-N-acetylmuramoylalanine--D-glutamate ligase [Salisediminibacterium beveridgei]